jgi:uncharacterized membrane protein YdbT with pleckstrin-like domain
MSYSSKLFSTNENVHRVAKRHVLFVLLHTAPHILGAIVLWSLAGLGYWLDFRYQGVLGAILLAVSLAPLGIALYRFLWWRAEEYIVTSLRIVQVEGIFSRRTLDSSLGQVNDVEMNQSVFGRMFDFGDINIITGSDVAINDLHGISQPFEFKKSLIEAKSSFDGQGPRRNRAADADIPRDTRNNQSTGSNVEDVARVLAALTELRNSGVLSEAEYQAKLQEVMTSPKV